MNTNEMLSVMIVTFQSWLDFQALQYAKEGKEVDDSSHIIQLPKYPSRAVVEEWIKILRYAAEESSQVTVHELLTIHPEIIIQIANDCGLDSINLRMVVAKAALEIAEKKRLENV